MKKIRLLLAEDMEIVRKGLKALLGSEASFEVVGEAEDGVAAVSMVDQLHPDIVLMDLSLPCMDGVEAIHEIKRHHPKVRILVLTAFGKEAYLTGALQAGVDGYLLKNSPSDELFAAIQALSQGQSYFSREVSAMLAEVCRAGNQGCDPPPGAPLQTGTPGAQAGRQRADQPGHRRDHLRQREDRGKAQDQSEEKTLPAQLPRAGRLLPGKRAARRQLSLRAIATLLTQGRVQTRQPRLRHSKGRQRLMQVLCGWRRLQPPATLLKLPSRLRHGRKPETHGRALHRVSRSRRGRAVTPLQGRAGLAQVFPQALGQLRQKRTQNIRHLRQHGHDVSLVKPKGALPP